MDKMKTLYFDCGMGAAGDMLIASLIELLPDPDSFIKEINALFIPNVKVDRYRSVKCGIVGTRVSVKIGEIEESEHVHEHSHEHGHEHSHQHVHEHSHERGHEHSHQHGHEHTHEHSHNGMHEISHIIDDLPITQKIKKDIMTVYSLIADAESQAHGVPVSQIHFHEVGMMDAVADITAFCLLIDKLKPDEIIVSPIHVGSGTVRCAHGILPVPAPATAYILKDVPIYGGRILGELCTPTGAALLKHFANNFGDMPVMKIQKIGYGMGKKDFETANCVRAMLGERENINKEAKKSEIIYELDFNVDDMTAEEIGFATERLFDGGAVEVFTSSIGMKKNRPGTRISVICRTEVKEKLVDLIFKHTTTIGIRENPCSRYVLEREIRTVNTKFGEIHRKDSTGYGVSKSKYEYEDIATIARENGMSFADVIKSVEAETFSK